MDRKKKYDALVSALKGYGRVTVAFSGGVDSSFLLYAACQALGHENVFALNGVSELVSGRERSHAVAILDELGVDHTMRVDVKLNPLNWPEFIINTAFRCYFCKKRMYQAFLVESVERGCNALLDGSNLDDLKRTRPGFRAIHELGVATPLLDAELSKDDIRFLACEFKLSTHDKESNSCLATRFSEGMILGKEGLALVEKCEEFLFSHGFSGCRVQPTPEKNVVLHVAERDMERLAMSAERRDIIGFFKFVGFYRVLVDLESR